MRNELPNPLYLSNRPQPSETGDANAVAMIFGFLIGAAVMASGVGIGAWLFA